MQLVRTVQSAVLTAVITIVGVGLVAPPQASAATGTTAGAARVQAQARTVPASYESEVLRLTNHERTRRGLRALTPVTCIERTSSRWATYLAARNVFRHQSMRAVSQACGTRYTVGENIAMGRPLTAARVVWLWMHSAGHRANILNKRYRHLSVGAARSTRNGATFVVQNFRS